jgi:hypothetical protein
MQTWKSHDGTVMLIKDMLGSHLLNTINMLKREITIRASIQLFNASRNHVYRNDNLTVNINLQHVWANLKSNEKLNSLIAEAKRRNLSL